MGGGVSEIQTLAEFKLLFFKDGFPYGKTLWQIMTNYDKL